MLNVQIQTLIGTKHTKRCGLAAALCCNTFEAWYFPPGIIIFFVLLLTHLGSLFSTVSCGFLDIFGSGLGKGTPDLSFSATASPTPLLYSRKSEWADYHEMCWASLNHLHFGLSKSISPAPLLGQVVKFACKITKDYHKICCAYSWSLEDESCWFYSSCDLPSSATVHQILVTILVYLVPCSVILRSDLDFSVPFSSKSLRKPKS